MLSLHKKKVINMTINIERKEVPVLLLTGYLGSGKTTLVNRILANKKGIKFAVIVNDIGEVNIDADLIEKGGIVGQGEDSLVPLTNGCICCTLKMDLIAQISDLTSTGKFDYIVIEASGICEPAPIAQTIASIPALGPVYIKGDTPYLDCIVTVVDALRMRDEFGCGKALEREDLDDEDREPAQDESGAEKESNRLRHCAVPPLSLYAPAQPSPCASCPSGTEIRRGRCAKRPRQPGS